MQTRLNPAHPEYEKLSTEQIEQRIPRRQFETSAGDLSRLISVNGRTLTAEEQAEEEHRLEDLVRNPHKLRELQEAGRFCFTLSTNHGS